MLTSTKASHQGKGLGIRKAVASWACPIISPLKDWPTLLDHEAKHPVIELEEKSSSASAKLYSHAERNRSKS